MPGHNQEAQYTFRSKNRDSEGRIDIQKMIQRHSEFWIDIQKMFQRHSGGRIEIQKVE